MFSHESYSAATDSLRYFEQRGYWVSDSGRVSSGWFALDSLGRDGAFRVIRRKIGGRRRYFFAGTETGFFVADSAARPGVVTRWGFAA